MIGSTISHYTILGKLGEGGMGVVYKAHDVRLRREVAIKFLPKEVAQDADRRERFYIEARAASALNHPNVGVIYDIDEFNGEHFIAMEYIRGKDLREWMGQAGRQTSEVLGLAMQIASGLHAAHEQGIVHRDIKPENIMVTPEGRVKIMDFGLAKIAGGTRLTLAGTIMGTVAYMSPEQIRGEDVDHRSDIWAFGVVLYEMLTLQCPFSGDMTTMLYAITSKEAPHVSAMRNDVSPELEAIIAKTLAKNPADRYQDLGALIADLAKVNRGDASTSTILLRPTLALEEQERRALTKPFFAALRRRKVLRNLIAALVAATMLSAGVIIYRSWNPPPPIESIAILPLRDASADMNTAYFSDGITAELVSSLRSLSSLRVLQFSGAAELKQQLADPLVAGKKLNVDAVLQGSVSSQVERITLDVVLLDVRSGSRIWEGNYNNSLSEVFSVFEDIRNNVIAELDLPTTPATRRSPAVYATSNADAYKSYLLGMYSARKNKKDDVALSIEYFLQTLQKDSQYVPALVEMALSRQYLYQRGWDENIQGLADAEANCRKALRLDSTNAQAVAVLGGIETLRGNLQTALEFHERALSLDPQNKLALSGIAYLYLARGEPMKALTYYKQVERIDPTNAIVVSNVGIASAAKRDYPEAIAAFKRAIALDPNREDALSNVGFAYERIENYDSAYHYYLATLRSNPREPDTYMSLVDIMLMRQQYAAAESTLSNAMKERFRGNYDFLYRLGFTYYLWGKRKEAQRVFAEGLQSVQMAMQGKEQLADNYVTAALFHARIGEIELAIKNASEAAKRDSMDYEVVMKVARVYAVLGLRDQMTFHFGRAKGLNPEYDLAFLATSPDFEDYRDDAYLRAIAGQK
jgi:serine/threonine protein kinase/Tfp pilus assembly protein PilF